jgi:hypothetical protein
MSTTPVHQSPFKKQRTHRVIRRFKRGPDKKLHFDGEQPGEEIRRIVREHPIFFLRSGVPFYLAVILAILVVWGNSVSPQLDFLWHFLEVLSAIAILATGLYFAYRVFELWWVNVDIVTNKRILTWHGLTSVTRRETGLEKITQVAVDQRTLFAVLFNYGDVKAYVAGGKDLDLLKVSNPKEVRDDIEGVRQSYLQAQPKKSPPPPVLDSQLSGVLAKLATPDKLPEQEDADKKYEHRRDPRKLRGPLRTFGGPLRIPCDVHYDADEYTIRYVQRSWILLVYRLFIPALIMIGLFAGAILTRNYFPLFAIGFFIVLIVIGLTIINYVDDVFILTNKRIIDIERKFIFLVEEHDTTTYDKITEVTVTSPNVLELALNVGNLHIWTPGSAPNIHMSRIDDPFELQDQIYMLQGFKSKVDKAKAANDRKAELNIWFSTVLSTLETRVNNRGVPNLQTLDLWDAVERAGEFGMKVVPIGETANYPNIPPGRIVSQSPPPGTLIATDQINPENKPQIQVIISKSRH